MTEIKERKRKKFKHKVDYSPQLYPGSEPVAERRRKIMNPNKRLIKLRDIPDDEIVMILGHRSPGALYTSIHPPLDEIIEPFDPVKHIIKPTAGARAGDRMRFVQFSDSFWRPVIAPWLRARLYFSRFRGVDTVIYSGRQLLEMRERDIEEATRILIETELFDPARTALRGLTVHGHALRLDSNGLMFDARKRYVYDPDINEVIYVKDMHAQVLDEPIAVGRPLTEEELMAMDVTYRWDSAQYKSRTDILAVIARISKFRILGGFKPDLINGR